MNEQSKIKAYREAHGLSQLEMAEKLGVNQATISRAEKHGMPLPKPASILFDMLAEKQARRSQRSGVAA